MDILTLLSTFLKKEAWINLHILTYSTHIDLLIRETIRSVYNSVEVVKYLVNKRKFVSLNEKKDYCVKLLSGYMIYSVDIIKYLVEEEGTDINGQNVYEDTALHNVLYSCNFYDEKRIEIIKYLVAHPECELNKRNNENETALAKYISYHSPYIDPSIVEIVLEAYAQRGIELDDEEKELLSEYKNLIRYYEKCKSENRVASSSFSVGDISLPKKQMMMVH